MRVGSIDYVAEQKDQVRFVVLQLVAEINPMSPQLRLDPIRWESDGPGYLMMVRIPKPPSGANVQICKKQGIGGLYRPQSSIAQP